MYSKWLELPISTRRQIASKFGIVQKSAVEVFNDTVKNDGYHIKDVELALTKESIQKYLESDENELPILWNELIKSIK